MQDMAVISPWNMAKKERKMKKKIENEEKNRIDLYNWQLWFAEGEYRLSGIAEYYPDYGKDCSIHGTSTIQDITLENDILRVETKHSVYSCPLKYMKFEPYGNLTFDAMDEWSHFADGSDDPVKKIVAVSAKMRIKLGGHRWKEGEMEFRGRKEKMPYLEKIKPEAVEEDDFFKYIADLQIIGQKELKKREEDKNNRLLKIVKGYGDSIYLEVDDGDNPGKLAFYIEGEAGIIKPEGHTGMVQDSVLYIKYPEGDSSYIDFRYFPKGWGSIMETYSWSENIKQAVIKNAGEKRITFNEVQIKPGETKVFPRKPEYNGG